jgi:hypothetical protein
MAKATCLLLTLLGLTLAAGAGQSTAPFWNILAEMTPAERANAHIDFELDPGQPEPVVELAREIEALWNSGSWDAALARLPELAARSGANHPPLGIAWRKPVPEATLGIGPYPIGTRDSVYVLDFEVDWRVTRRFYCVLGFEGDGHTSRMSVNLSTDLGRTWSEVYLLGGYTYKLADVAGRIMISWYWLTYTGGLSGAPNHALWSRKFWVGDGSPDTFRNGAESYNFHNTPAADTIKELAMVSNQLPANGTIYLLALTAADSLRFFTMPTNNDTAWETTRLAFTDARAGLDACWPDNWLSGDTALMYVSYVGRNDSVCVNRMILGGAWERIRAVAAQPSGYITSVAAHKDTVMIAYSDDGRIRYQLKRGGGVWVTGSPPQDTTLTNTIPDVSGEGGYFHLVYRDNTGKGWYTRRTYDSYTWDPAKRFDGDTIMALGIKPDVRWTGRAETAGVAWGGIVSGPGAHAFYSCFDYSAVAEPETGTPIPALGARPSRSGVIIRYSLDRPGPVTLRARDVTGRVLRTWQLAGTAGRHEFVWSNPGTGVRFLELKARDRRSAAKVSVAR